MPPSRSSRSVSRASVSRPASQLNSQDTSHRDEAIDDSGREDSPSEVPERVSRRHEWGRILLCGGTDWERNAHPPSNAKGVTLTNDDHPVPVKPRYISHLKITQVIGGPMANYSIAIDLAGTAHVFGRLPFMGLKDGSLKFKRWNTVSCDEPLHVPGPAGSKWEGGAVAARHFLLFSGGKVYGAGDNRANALGVSGIEFASHLVPIPGPWEESGAAIRQVAAGATFSLFLDSHGFVYASGKSQYGQLGDGTAGEIVLKGGKIGYDYAAPPRRITALADKRIVAIACGSYHALALDSRGRVYGWGNNVYANLGLGDFEPRLRPTRVEQFAGVAVTNIYAGHESSVVITDNEGPEVWIAGKCKMVGPGSASAPYERFERLTLPHTNVLDMSLGFISHFATVLDDDDEMRTYAWGQGATHGELGIGKEWLSALDPTPISHLDRIEVLSVAAGLVHTVFLVRPDSTLEERIGMAACGSDDESDNEEVGRRKKANGKENGQEKGPSRGRPMGKGKWKGKEKQEDGANGNGNGKGKGKGKANGNGNGNGKGRRTDDDGDDLMDDDESARDRRDLAIARWPPVESRDFCLTCREGEVEDMTFLECERCEEGYHIECLQPQLFEVPEGEWFCPRCEQDADNWSHPPREEEEEQ